ncbi:MAG: DUF6773 family protein [Lachnospiraceae bacterium]
MKQYLDERQSQALGKYAMESFAVMYLVCAVVIVVQLYVRNGDFSLVLGETIIMLAGGIVYLHGVIKTGTFSSNGISKGKNSIFVNISISIFISAVFSLAYGMIISKLAKNEITNIGKVTAIFFVSIAILCFVVLAFIGVFSDRAQRKSEKKYEDTEDTINQSVKPVEIYMASTSMESEMLIEMLSNCGISAYKQSIDGGIIEVYSGNSNKGDYIFVAEKDAEQAKQIIEESKLS